MNQLRIKINEPEDLKRIYKCKSKSLSKILMVEKTTFDPPEKKFLLTILNSKVDCLNQMILDFQKQCN